MSDKIEYSIIIPFREWSADLDECLLHIQRLIGPQYEVLLLPDYPASVPEKFEALPIVLIDTGPVSPAIKRDIGSKQARGEYLAFIDDDAYPFSDWLVEADRYFNENPDVSAVGGPAITPKTDSFWSRVSGAVFLSSVGGGFPERYVPIEPPRFVDDWPSVNLLIRKDIFFEIGGFDSNYWPGEDTKLCREIIMIGGKIRYLPTMRVWHHRRASLKKHLRQVGNYGYHRGRFARDYPENSRRLVYFIPSAFFIFLVLGFLGSIASPYILIAYSIGLAMYGLSLIKAVVDICRYESPTVGMFTVPYIFLTHVWYGVRFLYGFIWSGYEVSLGR